MLTYKECYIKSQNEYPAANIGALITSHNHEAFSQNTAPANTLATTEIMKLFVADTQTLVLPVESLGPVQKIFAPTVTKAMRLNEGDLSLAFGHTQTVTVTGYV